MRTAGLEPVATFRKLPQEYGTWRLRPPFDDDARRAAGFSERELALLEELAGVTDRPPINSNPR
ncbi:MAG: hypothetical protein A2140_06345 [Candidatus Muproteobacteria bacterium RBG_16_62_13]|uniref:Uncharacterized protein n=1 Tax=Candidatus Muproteobacteria bacterium RBG_16_62_13 TaxID=1817756 RepID=A0A1F6SY98_9PROT|nr:MAG: hypothetical protein A2140_06345 [Candidatus Muproteobacteria bacterium RBG_16_62_13]